MAGTKAGAEKRRETMIAKFGSEEAYIEHMKQISSIGGTNGGRGGFAQMDKKMVRELGAKGGKAPRKTRKQSK